MKCVSYFPLAAAQQCSAQLFQPFMKTRFFPLLSQHAEKRLLVLVHFPRMWIKCVPGLKVIDFQSRGVVKSGAGTDWPRVFTTAGNVPQRLLKLYNHAEGTNVKTPIQHDFLMVSQR